MLSATRQRCESRLYPQLKQVLDLVSPEGCKADLTYVTLNGLAVIWTRDMSIASLTPYRNANTQHEGKEKYLYGAIYTTHSLNALRHGSHSFTCKLHHACLSFVNVHQMAPPLTEDWSSRHRVRGRGATRSRGKLTPTFSSTWSTCCVWPPLFVSNSDYDPHFSSSSTASASIAAYYSFMDREGMKGWVCLVGWPIADGLPT